MLPATAVADESFFVTRRSAVFVTVSVSSAELLALVGSVVPTGAVIEAVFATVAVAPGDNVAVSV